MKVLIFQNTPAPYRNPTFKRLSEKTELTVVFGTSKTKDRYWHNTNVEYPHHFLNGISFRIRGKIITYAKGLIKYLKKKDLDICIINDDLRCVLSNLILIKIMKKKQQPILLWCGAIDTAYRRNVMLPKFFKILSQVYLKYLVKKASAYLAYGPKTVNFYSTHYKIPDKKIIWGTQAAELEPNISISKKSPKSDQVKFLYLGHLEERKGIQDLIDAVKSLDRKDYKLYIAGKGPEESQFKELAKNNPRIEFLGYVEGKEKEKCYLEADVFVSPTHHDPWANTINEACLYGLPIITTTAEGAEGPLALDKHNALVVPPGNIKRLQEALEFFLNNRESILEMGEKSKLLVQKFNLDWAVDNFMKAILITQKNVQIQTL